MQRTYDVARLSREVVEGTLHAALANLYENDLVLLKNDVSERAISHKLAEYLQQLIPEFDVDCEYNRNVELGEMAQKTLNLLKTERRETVKALVVVEDEDEYVDELLAVSTYPDIIVHRRTTNDRNVLVVELKKANSRVSTNYDARKLKAFTRDDDLNHYNYGFGVLIVLSTGLAHPTAPRLTWFQGGRSEAED